MVAVAAAVLLLLASPSTAASEGMTAERCDSMPNQQGHAIPTCCAMSDCPLCHCSSSSAPDGKLMLTSRLVPSKNACVALSRTSVSTGASSDPAKPLRREPDQESPSSLCPEHHCRDCLDSDGPHPL